MQNAFVWKQLVKTIGKKSGKFKILMVLTDPINRPQYVFIFLFQGEIASIHSEEENQFIYENLGGLNQGPPFRKTLIGLKNDKWLDGSSIWNYNKWDTLPETSRDDCVFFGGYSTGPNWIINDCFDQYNKFDCACKKRAI